MPEHDVALSARDRAILEFERLRWLHAGTKDTAVQMLFGMTWVRYVQVLQGIIDTPAALEYDAPLVRRLLRLRAGRSTNRPSRRVGFVV